MNKTELNKLNIKSITDLYKIVFNLTDKAYIKRIWSLYPKTKDRKVAAGYVRKFNKVKIDEIYNEMQKSIDKEQLLKLKYETIEAMWKVIFNLNQNEVDDYYIDVFADDDDEGLTKFKNLLIDEIYNELINRLKPLPPKLTPDEAHKNLKRHDYETEHFNYLNKLKKQKRFDIDDKLNELRDDNNVKKAERLSKEPKSAEFKDELKHVHDVFHRMRKEGIKSFNEYKEFQYGELQQDLIDKVFETLDMTPSKWYIDFSSMTIKTREAIFDKLKSWLNNVLGEMMSTQHFLIRFNVNGKYTTKTLTSERFRSLMERFTKKSFVYCAEFQDNSLIIQFGKRTNYTNECAIIQYNLSGPTLGFGF